MARAGVILILLAVVALAGCATKSIRPDIYFLPCEPGASVSFEGLTQMGRETHRLELRRLAFISKPSGRELDTQTLCVLYIAGQEYGPSILRHMDGAFAEKVRMLSSDVVEVHYMKGVRTHFRQRWKLVGHTAELMSEDEINWNESP